MRSIDRLRDLRNGSFRRVVIPLVLLLAIIVPSLRVLSTASGLPTWDRNLCQMSLIRSGEQPSDVVFLGSSRTGAAIDVERFEQTFGGDLQTAEKVVFTLGSELDRNLAYRTYVEHRGVPRVLAVELSFERYTDRVIDQGSLYRTTSRSETLFEARAYRQMLASLRSRGDAPLADTYMRSAWSTPGGFFFRRLGIGFDFAMRDPSLALDPSDTCAWPNDPREGSWIVGNSEPYDEAKAKIPQQEKLDRWTRNSGRMRPLDLDDPYTEQEMVLLNDLVEQAHADGVESVFVYYLPSYAERADSIDLDAVSGRLPGVEVFDARTVMGDPQRPSLRLQHFNANHVNRFAAYEISVTFADRLEASLR
jgi:hypothetical protein